MNTYLVLLHCIKKNSNAQQKFLKCVCVWETERVSLEISPKGLGATHLVLGYLSCLILHMRAQSLSLFNSLGPQRL